MIHCMFAEDEVGLENERSINHNDDRTCIDWKTISGDAHLGPNFLAIQPNVNDVGKIMSNHQQHSFQYLDHDAHL